eukprot:TRINITY_DN4650_c1_g2_i1.p1 TRINITY_DN4650_c1_g2~~TRINITY_DN4650_c1_g2_i1.p1  ORF type:complete len:358 (-),score=22.14 TRINITY_DN4650_c1_g2_i1:3794-4867(-)
MSRMSCLAEALLLAVWGGVLLCVLISLGGNVKERTLLQSRELISLRKRQVSEMFLNTSSRVHGLQQKDDLPARIAWHQKYDNERKSVAESWLTEGGVGIQPPIADRFPCAAFVSHKYRFIFVKQLVTYSEDFFKNVLGGECTGEDQDSHCMIRLVNMDEDEAEHCWKNYFVFTIVRNPWVRAIRTFQMLQRTEFLDVTNSKCFTQREHFCQHPFRLMQKCLELPECCKQQSDNVFVQLHRQSNCLRNSNGQAVIDYIARAEHLEEDLNAAIDIINEKYREEAMPKLPKLARGQYATLIETNIEDLGFHKNDKCIRDLAWHYQDDVDFLGLEDVIQKHKRTMEYNPEQDEMIQWISQF